MSPSSPSPNSISRRMAERHEAVYLRLETIARQVDAIAAKKPEGAVPEAMRGMAEAVLFESHGFRQHKRKGGLVAAAPHYGALAVQLGAALATMVAYEARHTRYHHINQLTLWLVEGEALPVRRLQPRPARGKPAPEPPRRDMADLRNKLAIRIEQYKRR